MPGCAACGGQRQSPIDINKNLGDKTKNENSLKITNGDLIPESVTLSNDGHGVSYQLNFANGEQVTMTGGPLGNATYVLHSFHTHWQSEHSVNGKTHDAEVHLVHYKSDYGSLSSAKTQPDGLAVLGFFFEIKSQHKLNNAIFDYLQNVLDHGTTETVNWAQSINDLITSKPFSIYSYPGSLTTPTCNEVVTWMVRIFIPKQRILCKLLFVT